MFEPGFCSPLLRQLEPGLVFALQPGEMSLAQPRPKLQGHRAWEIPCSSPIIGGLMDNLGKELAQPIVKLQITQFQIDPRIATHRRRRFQTQYDFPTRFRQHRTMSAQAPPGFILAKIQTIEQ